MELKELFEKQAANQEKLLANGSYNRLMEFENAIDCAKGRKSIPFDDTKLFSYHIQQLMSEIGEVLESDKRWKNFRNDKFDIEGKKLEIADCFIVLMNIAMFSGISGEELEEVINEKIEIVKERLEK